MYTLEIWASVRLPRGLDSSEATAGWAAKAAARRESAFPSDLTTFPCRSTM